MLNQTPRRFVGATVFRIAGLTSSGGEQATTEAIQPLHAVESVRVEAASATVTVTTSGLVDRADIAQAVSEAGYVLLP